MNQSKNIYAPSFVQEQKKEQKKQEKKHGNLNRSQKKRKNSTFVVEFCETDKLTEYLIEEYLVNKKNEIPELVKEMDFYPFEEATS